MSLVVKLSHKQKILVAVVSVSAITLLAIQSFYIAQLKSEVDECRAEATAWYNANATQSDETLKWMLQGQQNGTLDYTISQMYAKEGHDLHCIEPRLLKE